MNCSPSKSFERSSSDHGQPTSSTAANRSRQRTTQAQEPRRGCVSSEVGCVGVRRAPPSIPFCYIHTSTPNKESRKRGEPPQNRLGTRPGSERRLKNKKRFVVAAYQCTYTKRVQRQNKTSSARHKQTSRFLTTRLTNHLLEISRCGARFGQKPYIPRRGARGNREKKPCTARERGQPSLKTEKQTSSAPPAQT